MTPKELRDAIIEQIRTWLPGLRHVASHPGRFSKDEISRAAFATPAAFVGTLKLGDGNPDGDNGVWYPVTLVIYIAAKNSAGLPAHEACLNMTTDLLRRIPFSTWGLEGDIEPAPPATAENLYTGGDRNHGLNLWAVTFLQQIRLSCVSLEESEFLPEEVYVGIAPEIGEPHVEDYERVHPPEEVPV